MTKRIFRVALLMSVTFLVAACNNSGNNGTGGGGR